MKQMQEGRRVEWRTEKPAKDAHLMLKNGTLASPATALASRVLPVPGGPTKRTPEGARAPSLVNLSGLFNSSCEVAEAVHAGLVK